MSTDEAERNRAWYAANRKLLRRGKWYIVDDGKLAMGPFNSSGDMQRYFETQPCRIGEHAYYVRAGAKDPESIDETLRRCRRLLRELHSAGQHHKLEAIEDLLYEMRADMHRQGWLTPGKYKDFEWEPPARDAPAPLTTDDVLVCEGAFRALLAGVARPETPYHALASSYDKIVAVRDRVIAEWGNSDELAPTVLAMYDQAVGKMVGVWARAPADDIIDCGGV